MKPKRKTHTLADGAMSLKEIGRCIEAAYPDTPPISPELDWLVKELERKLATKGAANR